MEEISRRRLLAVASGVGAAGLAGCGALGSGSGPGAAESEGRERQPSPGGTEPDSSSRTASTPSAARGPVTDVVPTTEEVLPLPRSPSKLRSAALSGGPPKDGIPSVDDPSFVPAGAAGFLNPGDPVFGVARGDDVKAYPQKILVHHEIVNDVLDGDPVAVTYCPLTGTVQGFDRGETTFGVSGRLINNNLVMYDRATETWWPQIPATSIPGPWNEDPPTASLQEFRLVWTTWEQWRSEHPDTAVLSTDTGYARNYGSDPYGSYNPKAGYYTRDSTLFPKLNPDDRYHPKRVFLGARNPDGAVAFDKQTLLSAGTMPGQLGGTPVVAVADPRFDTGYVYLNPDEQEFTAVDGQVRSGDGKPSAPDDLPLERVIAFDAMWFAWIGYYPDSNVYA